MANAKPTSSAVRPRRIRRPERRPIPSAMLVMAPYSGPTTIAATIRICELVMMPTAAMTRNS